MNSPGQMNKADPSAWRLRGIRQAAWILVSLALSVLTLWLACRRHDISVPDLLGRIGEADTTVFTLLAAASVVWHVALGTDRLWRVLRAMRVNISFMEVMGIRLASGPLRLLMPMKTGELINILYFHRHKRLPIGKASGAVVFDRGLNVIGAVFWLLIGILLAGGVSTAPLIWTGIAISMIYVVFFFMTPFHTVLIGISGRINQALAGFMEGILSPFRDFTFGQKAFFVLYGILFQVRPLAVCYLLFRAAGISPDADTFLLNASLALFAGHVPSFAGVGPRELAFVEIFGGYGADKVFGIGILMAVAVFAIPTIIGIPLIPWYLRRLVSRGDLPEQGGSLIGAGVKNDSSS